MIYQLIKALYFLHTADLIHRDVKPSNLCVRSPSARARVRAHTERARLRIATRRTCPR